MKEYIERAAVKDEILSWAGCINHPELLRKEDTMYCIDNIPAADVVEVRHGRWLLDGRCSECLANPLTTHKNYCPNCGAFMQEEGNGEK